MRIMGFQKQWVNHLTGQPKLAHDEFTTFRWPRRDRDWEVGETIQIVMNPRTKGRIPLGEAVILYKEARSLYLPIPGIHTAKLDSCPSITTNEAMMDGSLCASELRDFLAQHKLTAYELGLERYGKRPVPNRLTLLWEVRYDACPKAFKLFQVGKA